MSDLDLQRKWDLIEELLKNACSDFAEQPQAVIAPHSELLVEANHFLDHNELGLALDTIAEAGRVTNPGARFWDSLRQAASQMERAEDAREFQLLWVEDAAASLKKRMGRA
jgi:hypothetical protein